ncbi:baseplate J/gp47 family protein [Sandarakinorhabdus oryzae]|uniref:hypothetical protein n=1 Tax=Sandarakinorhabdus oryzae TaxID=2675220 RepID=UPI001F37E17F|nr:hypothetical protein [Sandarakinorhabdus oryzae]
MMPINPPVVDDRDYAALVSETLARVPVHTPEWTNFNAADPGVTLVQLFAFLTESLIFRANQIPERNRAAFLNLLGIPLQPAQPARALVQFTNKNGPGLTRSIAADADLAAGALPFRSLMGLDLLPVDARLFIRRPVANPSPELLDYYKLLYASLGQSLAAPALYESVPFDPAAGPLDPAGSIDNGFWIGLFARERDLPGDPADPWAGIRDQLGGRILSLGLQPVVSDGARTLPPQGSATASAAEELIRFHIAKPEDGKLRFAADGRPAPDWAPLSARFGFDPSREAGVAQVTLPPADALKLWDNLEPLDAGVGNLPPAIGDAKLADRLVTWVRVSCSPAAALRLAWAGINCALAEQRREVRAEPLGEGDGSPDQTRRLAKAPVLAGSVVLTSITAAGTETTWTQVPDLLDCAPEVAAPGQVVPAWAGPSDAYRLDPESGEIRFGDGLAGRRPQAGERLQARYQHCDGAAGNVGAGAIKAGPLLGGIEASNPLPAWGGADAERVADGERQIQRLLTHRDRLVTAEDFRSIAWRAPGLDIGRIEVLPAWHPDLATAGMGHVPGVVTLLAIPAQDARHPAAPRSDAAFLDALCRWLDPRRLVTTELVLRGADYKGLYISVGLDIAPGHGAADVIAAVRARLSSHLAPLPPDGLGFAAEPMVYGEAADDRGWPLGKAVAANALLAEVARVAGVEAVTGLELALSTGGKRDEVSITGIELPEILGLSVVVGPPVPIAQLRGDSGSSGAPPSGPPLLPVPIVPETC